MKTTSLRLFTPVLLALGTGTPAFAQTEPASQFSNFVCEIDLSVVPVGFKLADGTTSLFTFDSTRLCTGSASARNVTLNCQDTVPGWNKGAQSVKGFPCTINGDTCNVAPNVAPLPGDSNKPFLTTTNSTLAINSNGVAKLTCLYNPP